MKKNILGKTGLEVSILGFGGIPIQRISEEEAVEVIGEAKNQGINFIDTANGYTVSEGYIGKALKKYGRSSFYIATKAMGYTYDDMKNYVDESLRRMEIDCIDLYQMHNCSKPAQFEAAMSENSGFKALLEAKEQGKIKHIGVTAHNVDYIEKFLELDYIETIQVPFNIIEQQAEKVFKKALSKNVGVIAMKPMAGGAIRDADLALRYIFNSGLVTVAIPGVDSIEQVRQNAKAALSTQPWTEEDFQKAEQVRAEVGTDFCRRCGYCFPCPQNIDIPNVFTFEAYVSRYGLSDFGKSRYENLPAKATDCIECGLCEERCPYNLPIREKLKAAAETFAK